MTSDDVRRVVSAGESQDVEFKLALSDVGMLARLIAGFANAAGGVLLVGVKEPDEVVGADVGQARRLFEAALRRLDPRPDVGFSAVGLDGRQVVVIDVHPADGLVLADGGAFGRSGSSTRALTAGEVTRLLREPRPDVSHALDRIVQALATQSALVQDQNDRLQAQRQQLEVQQATIEEFSSRFTASQTPRGKAVEWLISGVIGAMLGQLVTLLFA